LYKSLFAIIALVWLSGCASVLNDSTHPLKIETRTASGETVTGADCKLTNDYGDLNIKSGESVNVHRSSNDLHITCQHPSNPDAKARTISRVNSAMFGNILIGGLIGAAIDHTNGRAYTYPTWIQLVFGKTLIFDRSAEKEGQPNLGAEPMDDKKQAAK
jgi:hypothetical protein